MDEYDHDLQLDDHDNVNAWLEEEKDDVQFDGAPDDLWANWPVDKQPPEPESWIDRIADKVELARLCSMGVLVEGKFGQRCNIDFKVCVWLEIERAHIGGWDQMPMLVEALSVGGVAREYAFWEKRADTYAPPISSTFFLWSSCRSSPKGLKPADEDVCLGTLNVKDVFLQAAGYATRNWQGEALVRKALWIQDAVRNGVVELSQIRTTWNISDIGTKPLGVQRVRFLLHELNMASGKDFMVVGEVENQEQCSKHGGGREMSKVGKQILRMLSIMGLESMTLRGMAGATILDDDSFSEIKCFTEPNHAVSRGGILFTLWIFIAWLGFVFVGFLWKVWKLAKGACSSYEQTYTDVAVMEGAIEPLAVDNERLARDNQSLRQDVNALQVEFDAIQTPLRRLREGHNEFQGELEMVQDSSEIVFALDWFKWVVFIHHTFR
eukprot:s92_g1.t1